MKTVKKAYFITATDTDAGKTFVSSGILQLWSDQGFKTLGFKPVASGCSETSSGLRNDDALKLIAAANVSLDYKLINPYSFEPAIAPHIAAQQAGVNIDVQVIADSIAQYCQHADHILVEGVGGWLVPLNTQQTIADLASLLGFPVILVVNIRLGCINHALLTAQAIAEKGLTMAGWIANSPEPGMACLEENIESLKALLSAPLLGVLPHFPKDKLDEGGSFTEFIDLEKCI